MTREAVRRRYTGDAGEGGFNLGSSDSIRRSRAIGRLATPAATRGAYQLEKNRKVEDQTGALDKLPTRETTGSQRPGHFPEKELKAMKITKANSVPADGKFKFPRSAYRGEFRDAEGPIPQQDNQDLQQRVMYIMSMEATHMHNPLRYFVGSQPTARGGWFVAAVIVSAVGGKETSRFYRQNIQTKKEAKALAASLNEELTSRNKVSA